MEALGYILLWFFLIIFFIDFLLLLFWAFTFFKNKTPFIPVSIKALPYIEKALDIKAGDIVYDLGSGDGRVIYYLAKKYPNTKFIGIENNPFATLLNHINIFFIKKDVRNNLVFKNNDFFKEDLSNATHIFSYIYPNEMDDLLIKFDNDFKGAVKMVSVNYRFTNKRPVFEVDLERDKYNFARTLYVYEF